MNAVVEDFYWPVHSQRSTPTAGTEAKREALRDFSSTVRSTDLLQQVNWARWWEPLAGIRTAVPFLDFGVTPKLTASLRDFSSLLGKLGGINALPRIDFDNIGELSLEWRTGNRIAIGSLEGDGVFGYAIFQNGQFVPGEDFDVYLDQPQQLEALRAYLAVPEN